MTSSGTEPITVFDIIQALSDNLARISDHVTALEAKWGTAPASEAVPIVPPTQMEQAIVKKGSITYPSMLATKCVDGTSAVPAGSLSNLSILLENFITVFNLDKNNKDTAYEQSMAWLEGESKMVESPKSNLTLSNQHVNNASKQVLLVYKQEVNDRYKRKVPSAPLVENLKVQFDDGLSTNVVFLDVAGRSHGLQGNVGSRTNLFQKEEDDAGPSEKLALLEGPKNKGAAGPDYQAQVEEKRWACESAKEDSTKVGPNLGSWAKLHHQKGPNGLAEKVVDLDGY